MPAHVSLVIQMQHSTQALVTATQDAIQTQQARIVPYVTSSVLPVLLIPLVQLEKRMRQLTVQQDAVFHACSAVTPLEFMSGSKVKLGLNRAAFDDC